MALLDFSQQILGQVKVYGAPVGASDLPTAADFFNLGDIVLNIGSSNGEPLFWTVTNLNPLTFSAAGQVGFTSMRTAAGATTITPTDSIVFVSAAATVTLQAPTTMPVGGQVIIKNTSAGVVTLSPVSGNIDGAATVTIAAQGADHVLSTGLTYWTLS